MLFDWIKARAMEESTWMGVAGLVTALGFPEVAIVIGKVGVVAVAVLSGGLIAHKQ